MFLVLVNKPIQSHVKSTLTNMVELKHLLKDVCSRLGWSHMTSKDKQQSELKVGGSILKLARYKEVEEK